MNADESGAGTAPRKLVSIVVPFYNERDSLGELVARLQVVLSGLAHRYDFEVILVDDGSRDDGLALVQSLMAEDPRVRAVELRKNYGQTAALQAGLDEVRGELVISMDADLQHFPEEIPAFLSKIEEGYDVVCGWRHQRQETALRRWPSRVANLLIRKLSGLTIHDVGTTFRAYRRELVQDLSLFGENHRFVPVFASAVGARITEIPISNVDRLHGQSNYGIYRTLNVFIDLFFLFFFLRYLDRPIRIFGKLSLLAAGIATAMAIYLFAVWWATGAPVVRVHSGVFTAALVLYLASVQFLMGGILGELLSRVYFNTEDKSHYRVRKIWAVPQGEEQA